MREGGRRWLVRALSGGSARRAGRMIRHQIRNEYGLADPEVYAAPGEEDDPEALLEGVAMAGLVGVLRQLGDLAEFAAEIFHDLHEEAMATASRGHGLMLRLQQLEAEFPAVEKAIISQTEHSNYPHDDGAEWHSNVQLKQNVITQGDMPRFIMDSYEECRGPPQLFTLDKFDVAGAGASLKRYSDPSFFKTEHASNMIEADVLIENKPRRIKKKAMRWRKGATLESLLTANSESQITPKDRTSRKVPPRTTKLKSRQPRSPDHKTTSRILREHLQEVILSQKKIISRYSVRHYYVKFGSPDSSETAPPFGEMDSFGALVQSSGKLDLTKVVPVNESDAVDTKSEPIDGSAYLELGDKRNLGKQHEPFQQNGMVHSSEKLPDCPYLDIGESNNRSHLTCEEKPRLAEVPADQKDVDGRRPDDIVSDQDNFIGASNDTDMENKEGLQMKTECDPSASVELVELNRHNKEGDKVLYAEPPEVGPAIDSSLGLDNASSGEEPTCVDLPLSSDSAPTVSATNGPNSGSQSGRQMNGVDWSTDEESSNDVDLIDVSSSSSVVSENGDVQNNDCLVSCLQHEEAIHSLSDDHAGAIHNSDEQSPNTSSNWDDMAIGCNNYTEKVHHPVEHVQDVVLDDISMILSKPNDVSEDEDKISSGNADDLSLHPTKLNQEEIQELKTESEEGRSLESGSSPSKASLPNKDHVSMNDVEADTVTIPKETVADTAPTGLDPDGIDERQDGVAPKYSSIHNSVLYESYDDKIAEDTHSLLDDGLSTTFDDDKHVAEDHQFVVLEQRTCPTSLNTCKDDSMQGCAVARDFTDAEKLPGVVSGVLASQLETESHVGETLASTSYAFSDDTEALEIGVPLAPGTSFLPNTSSSLVEKHELTETEEIAEVGEFVVAKESTTSVFAVDVVPPKEFIDANIHPEKVEVLATSLTEEATRLDLQLQSPSREVLETTEAIHRNFGAVDESREDISKKSMLQTDNSPLIVETTSEKCSDRDGDTQFLVKSDYQEELLKEGSHNAEDRSLCDLNKDGAVTLKSNAVEKQPVNAGQDLAWGMHAQDSSSTNPFLDPAYLMSHTQIYSSSSMSSQPCFPEEEDFLSELVIQHDNMGVTADALWEPATPPDDAPLPSEIMTEDDFRSFCQEYHEIDFSSVTNCSHSEPASDSNKIPNAFLIRESDFPCYNSALPVKLDQEACIHSKFCSECVEYSCAVERQGTTSMVVSGKEDRVGKDETPGVDFHLNFLEFSNDNRSPELNMLSVPVDLRQELHGLPEVDSRDSSPLLHKEKTSEECCFSLSNNVVEVKQELEIRADLVPHSSINEKVDGLDEAVPVEPEAHACALDEYDNQDVPHISTSEKNETLTLGKPVLVQGPEVCAFGGFECDPPIIPSPSVDETKDNLEVRMNMILQSFHHSLRTSFQAEQKSECYTSGEHDSQTVPFPLHDENINELDDPPLSNADELDRESKACVPHECDAQIAPCSTDEDIHELDHPPLSSPALVDLESEDHVSDDRDSEVTPCLVKDKIDESVDAQPNLLPGELEQETHAPPELDFRVAPQSAKESDCSTEFDSQAAPCSSNIPVLANTTVSTCISAMPSSEETYQLSPVPPPTVQFQNDSYKDPQALLADSYKDPQAPPPLPPLQWRLGKPRLGLLSRKGCMTEPARVIDPVLQISSQEMDIRPGLLDPTDRSIEPVSCQEIKEDRCESSLIDHNDQNVDFDRLSTRVAVTDVARTEHRLSLETSEDIKQQGHISSSATGVGEHLDAGFTSTMADEEHLDDSGMTHGTALYLSDPLFPLPTYELQDPQPDTRENSEHPSQTHGAASGDDKSMDAVGSMESTLTKGHVSGNRCYQQPQHGESSSETSDHKEHITNASEDGVKHQSGTSEAPSDTAKHSAPGTLLKGNVQESQILQEHNVGSSEDDQPGGLLYSLEPVAPQGENKNQVNNPGLLLEWPGDTSELVTGLEKSCYAHAEQPPVMGWTVGPQMLHPKYGILEEESQFEPNIADNHLIRKPISIKNIPRNPLVDAVAAHDRSSMRKVSELAPPTDKPKPNERNMLLEQIRNKTFSLKPVAPAQQTAMRSPARTSTRNLKVAAIIEKANAIRQAVGSDDEDADSWSDT